MPLIGVVIWAVFAIALAMGATHVYGQRERVHKQRAIDEILAEHGTSRRPGEGAKQALVRARAEESMRPMRLASVAPSSMRIPAPSRPGFDPEELSGVTRSPTSWHD